MKPHRRDYMDMVESIHGNCFATFSFGHPRIESQHKVGRHPGWHPIPTYAVYARVGDFFDRMVAEAGGIGLVPNGLAFGFMESTKLNPHLHVIAALNNPQWRWLEDQGKAAWRRLSNQGQLHIEEIESPAKVLSYCTKRFTNQRAFEEFFIYPR